MSIKTMLQLSQTVILLMPYKTASSGLFNKDNSMLPLLILKP